jgi:3D (Asp-Asp-Asp) domain-containing protein
MKKETVYRFVITAGATVFVASVALTARVPLQQSKQAYNKVEVVYAESSETPPTVQETTCVADPNLIKEYICGLEPVKAAPTPTPTPTPEPELEYLGEFSATAYCGGACCCGVARDIPMTASGEPAQSNYIAVDPRVIPLGTYLYIEGADMDGYYYAMDTGSAVKGNIVDFYFGTDDDSHWRTEVFGRQTVWVYKVLED